MHTLFSYLNFPVLPKHLEQMVLDAKNDVDLDKFAKANEREVYGTKIAFVPDPVSEWVHENVLSKMPKNYNQYGEFACIHRHSYLDFTGESWKYKYKNAQGVVPMHKDFGRHYAINYMVDTGGENVYTVWWDDNFKEIKRDKVELSRWCILSTKVLHGVEGIEPGRDRVGIGLNWDPENIDKFDIKIDLQQFLC